jgi:hypothetical protein
MRNPKLGSADNSAAENIARETLLAKGEAIYDWLLARLNEKMREAETVPRRGLP